MEKRITVSLSPAEIGLLISALGEFVDYIEDIIDIQESIECSTSSFEIGGACMSAMKELFAVRSNAKNLKAKLGLLNFHQEKNKKEVNKNEN